MKEKKKKSLAWYCKTAWKKVKKGFCNLVDWICDIPKNMYQFYLDNFEMYMTICQSNEHVYIGKKLWYAIKEGMTPEELSDIRIWFKKYPSIEDNKLEYEYMMFVNPNLEGYETICGDKPFTAPLQFNVFGHIGFQAVQPTPAEIVYQYNLKCDFDDRVMIRVKPFMCNGEKAFILTRHIIGKPKPAHIFEEGEAELGELVSQ